MKYNCGICGKEDIGTWSSVEKTYRGHTCKICPDCAAAINNIYSKKQDKIDDGNNYLRRQLENNKTAPEVVPMVKMLLGEEEPEENQNRTSSTSSQGRSTEQGTIVSSSVPLFAGIIFLILAVILYFVSVNNDYGVANIQSSVFSAASFVAAIVCFAASRIINAVNSR